MLNQFTNDKMISDETHPLLKVNFSDKEIRFGTIHCVRLRGIAMNKSSWQRQDTTQGRKENRRKQTRKHVICQPRCLLKSLVSLNRREEVLCIGTDCDLALLDVPYEEFWKAHLGFSGVPLMAFMVSGFAQFDSSCHVIFVDYDLYTTICLCSRHPLAFEILGLLSLKGMPNHTVSTALGLSGVSQGLEPLEILPGLPKLQELRSFGEIQIIGIQIDRY